MLRQKTKWTETRNWSRWILFITFCATDSWQWLKMMNTKFGWECLSGSRTRWSKDVSTSSKGWLRQLWSENKCHVSCIAFEVNQYKSFFSHLLPKFVYFFPVYHGIPISRHWSIKRLKPCSSPGDAAQSAASKSAEAPTAAWQREPQRWIHWGKKRPGIYTSNLYQ